MKTESIEEKRAKLIDIARGGDGMTAPWLERITIRKPGESDAPGYIIHIPCAGNEFTIYSADLEAMQGLLSALLTGAKPADHEPTAEELAAWIAALPQPEDRGRIVTDIHEL